ncbi:hypothetical protein BJX96DRAFT_160778 [Aspergillus floccosus]
MTTKETETQAAPGRRNTRRWLSSPATWSTIISLLLGLSAFRGEQTIQARLARLAAAAALTFTVHVYLLLSSPPEQQELSSFLVSLVTGQWQFTWLF